MPGAQAQQLRLLRVAADGAKEDAAGLGQRRSSFSDLQRSGPETGPWAHHALALMTQMTPPIVAIHQTMLVMATKRPVR